MLEPLVALTSGALVGLAVAVPLGPIGLLVVDRSRRDLREGLAAGSGVAAADLVWAAAAVTVGAGLSAHAAMPVASVGARSALVAAGLYLLTRSLRELWRGPTQVRDAEVTAPTPGRWFVATFALTLPNPLTVGVFLAAAVSRDAASTTAAALAFALGAGGASLAWHAVLAIGARRLLRGAHGRLASTLTLAVAVALVLWPPLS